MTEILNLVVIFLLIVAIVYGFILNRKIVLIQNSKKELANLFKSFDNTILKAQVGIDDLKKVSNEISQILQAKMDKASFIIDDLSFLSEKATQASVRLEKLVSETRKSGNVIEAKVYDAQKIKAIKQEADKKIESAKAAVKLNASADVNNKRARVLEGLLEKISEKRAEPAPVADKLVNKKPVSAEAALKEKNDEERVANMLKAFGYGDS